MLHFFPPSKVLERFLRNKKRCVTKGKAADCLPRYTVHAVPLASLTSFVCSWASRSFTFVFLEDLRKLLASLRWPILVVHLTYLERENLKYLPQTSLWHTVLMVGLSEGPGPLWAVPPIDRWSWVIKEIRLSKP